MTSRRSRRSDSGRKRRPAVGYRETQKNMQKLRNHVSQMTLMKDYYYNCLMNKILEETTSNKTKHDRMKKLLSNYLQDEKDRKDGIDHVKNRVQSLVEKYQTERDTHEVISDLIYDFAVELVKLAERSEEEKLRNAKFGVLMKTIIEKGRDKKEAKQKLADFYQKEGKTEAEAAKMAEKHMRIIDAQKKVDKKSKKSSSSSSSSSCSSM